MGQTETLRRTLSGAFMLETTRLLARPRGPAQRQPDGPRPSGAGHLRAPRHRLPGRFLPRPRRSLGTAAGRPAARQHRRLVRAAGARRTLLLEAHQDTVPTDNMTIDPFAAVVENGRLYGRGACDIKGGMAAMLAAFARLVREKPAGAARVVMACTVDEEYTFLGVQRLVQTDLRGGCGGLGPSSPSRPAARSSTPTRGWSAGPAHGRPVVPQLARRNRASTPSTAWAVCCRQSSATPRSCAASAVDPLLGPADAERRPHRGRHQRQHRARPLPHRDRPPPDARRGRRRRGRPICSRSCATGRRRYRFLLRRCPGSAPRPEPGRIGGTGGPLAGGPSSRWPAAIASRPCPTAPMRRRWRGPACRAWSSGRATSPWPTPATNGCRWKRSEQASGDPVPAGVRGLRVKGLCT